MEAIRNYLETMFLNLPNTPEVYKAKNELWQMMEDKYTELKNEGKSENEAVGTVIAEFGNLDELAEDLGIKQFVHQPRQEQTPNAVSLSMEDVRQLFSTLYSGVSFLLALQVMEKVFPRWMVKSTTFKSALMDEKASRFFWLASTDVDIPLSLSSLSSPSSSQSEMASINSLKDGSPSATERPKRTRW